MKVAAAASMEVLNAVEWFSGMAGYKITLGNFSFRLVGVERNPPTMFLPGLLGRINNGNTVNVQHHLNFHISLKS